MKTSLQSLIMALAFSISSSLAFAWTSSFTGNSKNHMICTKETQDLSRVTIVEKQKQQQQQQQQLRAPGDIIQNRRSFVAKASSSLLLLLSSSSSFQQPSPAMAAAAASSSSSPTTTDIGKLSIEDAKKRFLLARQDVQYLLEHYDEISKKGGGDAIRNYLGTQGITSYMVGIQKVLKLLQDEADDVIEYVETMDEFNAYYYQAEGAAYQSLFAEHSSAKATPESLLATAKKDCIEMMKYMDQLATQLNL